MTKAEDERLEERRAMRDRILRAGAVVAIAHIFLKIISPVQYALVGQVCDKITRDLFIFASEAVLGVLFYVGEESLGPAFLPVFMEEKDKRGDDSAWNFANIILSFQFLVISAAALVVFLFPDVVVSIITRWNSDQSDPAFMELGPLYTRYIVFGLFGLSLGSTTYMILNGHKRFFLAAFGDASFKLGVVFALAAAFLLGEQVNGFTGMAVICGGVVFGSILKLLTHLIGLRKELWRLRPRFDWSNPAFRKFMLLVAPLLLGIVFAKFRDLYNNFYIMSTLDKGVLSAAAYGRKIHQSLGFLVPYAISIAMLPFFCEMVDRDRKEELGAMITKSSRLLILFCSPLAALLVVLSLPISRIIFQGGHYDYNDCLIASTANACYSLVLPFYALEYVLMQAFFANRKMVSITLIGMFFSTLSMLVCYVCVIRLGMTGTSAVAAVALAYTGTRMLKVFALGGVMRCFLPVFPAGETVGFLFRALLVAVATGCSAMGVRALYERLVQIPAEGGRMMLLPKIAPDIFLSGLAGTVVAIASAWFFCRADSEQIVVWFKEKLRRRRGAD